MSIGRNTIHMYDKYIGPIFIQSSLLPMGDGNAAFRLASNLKTPWLGSTCQGYGVSAYAIRTYSISVTLMCIFKLISKETCNTKKSYFSCILLLCKVLLWQE